MKGRTNENRSQGKAALYCRVSTEEQAKEGVSLEAQERALRAYCDMRGLEAAEVIVDAGVSAGKPLVARPGGSRLLEAVRAREVGAVVVWKLDRLFRNASECLVVTDTWDREGVAVHLVDLGGQSVDTTSAVGRFFLTMLAGMAELERNMIRERTADAIRHKQTKCEYTGGQVPYGWRVGEDGRLVEHEGEQLIVRSARKLRGEGQSLREVGRSLEEMGLLPRNGGKWNPRTIRNLTECEWEREAA